MNSRFKKFIASAAGFFDLSRHERVGAYAILAVLAIAVAAMALASRCTRGGVPDKVQRVPDVELFDSATTADSVTFAPPARHRAKRHSRKHRRAKASKPRSSAPERRLDPVPGF